MRVWPAAASSSNSAWEITSMHALKQVAQDSRTANPDNLPSRHKAMERQRPVACTSCTSTDNHRTGRSRTKCTLRWRLTDSGAHGVDLGLVVAGAENGRAGHEGI